MPNSGRWSSPTRPRGRSTRTESTTTITRKRKPHSVRSAGGDRGKVRRPDPSALGAGISILALGVLLLLQDQGAIDLEAGWLLAAGPALAALALASRSLSGPGAIDDHEPATSERETERLSWTGFAIAAVLGAALFLLWANGVLEAAGSAALAA